MTIPSSSRKNERAFSSDIDCWYDENCSNGPRAVTEHEKAGKWNAFGLTDTSGNVFTIPPDGIHIGRERGDVIFPEDGYVSGLHCRLHSDGQGIVLTDVGSSNGTFVRIENSGPVVNGELLLMGQQLFRLQFA